MSNCPGWTKWRPGSKCSFSCLVPARGLQMVTRRCLKPKEMCWKKTLKQMRSKKYSNIGPLGVCQANAKGSRPLFKSVKTPAQGLFNVNVKTPAWGVLQSLNVRNALEDSNGRIHDTYFQPHILEIKQRLCLTRCRKLMTPFQFASQTCETFQVTQSWWQLGISLKFVFF